MSTTEITGRLYLPGDPHFEAAALDRLFNHRRPASRPAAVLEAATVDDVVAGVKLAAERGWRVSARSGGHSWASWSLRDEALLIDLSGLSELTYDEDTNQVRASPSTTGAILERFLDERGRFFPTGHCPTVGIGGFLLQGGQGYNARGWGWSAELVHAIDVVTAQGELVHASETENADLFWAARGSGPGFFGIVTTFHLKTRPLPGAIARSLAAYPISLYDEIAPWFAAMQRTLPPIVEVVMLSTRLPGLGDDHHLLVSGVAMAETMDEARVALAPMESSPARESAVFRTVAEPTSIANEFSFQYEANPEGHRWAVDNAWISSPDSVSVPTLKRAFTELPTGKSFALWFSMDPLRELPDMAFSLQAPIYFSTYVIWEDERDDDANRAWLAERLSEIEGIADGCYLGDSDFTVRPARFITDAARARYLEIRERWDPQSRFVGYLGIGW